MDQNFSIMENLDTIINNLYDLALKYGLKLLLAIVTLIIGLWIIKLVMKTIDKTMTKRDVDATLRKFLGSLLSMLLKIMLIISVISMVGVEMTSFVAILAAAGLAVGMALSGTLQNFAGGVILVLFKPFKVGDFIEAQGFLGTVSEIQIFNTILKTVDNKTVIIPNGGLSTSAMTNFSTEPTRRVDFSFGIGYSDDIDKARKVIEGLIAADSRILKDPAPFIAVSELGNSSVKFAVRVWANSTDYWDIFFDMTENVKKAFDREGISIPFPQTDVHVYNEK
ncbi:MAG: mechanosensitive ion channel [Bacteroidales bacterium]|nr:mechanosensitive ion channel [Bacteroidales bacterium]